MASSIPRVRYDGSSQPSPPSSAAELERPCPKRPPPGHVLLALPPQPESRDRGGDHRFSPVSHDLRALIAPKDPTARRSRSTPRASPDRDYLLGADKQWPRCAEPPDLGDPHRARRRTCGRTDLGADRRADRHLGGLSRRLDRRPSSPASRYAARLSAAAAFVRDRGRVRTVA